MAAIPLPCDPVHASERQALSLVEKWDGFAPVREWNRTGTDLDPCARNGRTQLTLSLATPASWSRGGHSVEVKLVLAVSSETGEPIDTPQRRASVAALADIRKMLSSAEDDATVKDWQARYGVERVRHEETLDNLRCVVFEASTRPCGPAASPRTPTVQWCRSHRVTAYAVDAVTALPRPELKSLGEAVRSAGVAQATWLALEVWPPPREGHAVRWRARVQLADGGRFRAFQDEEGKWDVVR